MSKHTARAPGAMTSAMSALHPQPLARALRVGVFVDQSAARERLFRAREVVSLGTTERATFVLNDEAARHVELFVPSAQGWQLVLVPGLEGKLSHGGSVQTVSALRAAGPRVTLDAQSRGKLSLAGATVLFQFVVPPPESPRAQLPMGLKRSLARELDWRYNASLAVFLSIAVGALGYVEYGYDPVVTVNEAELIFPVRSQVRMDDATTPPEPAPPPAPSAEGAAAEPSTASRASHREGPARTAPSGRPGPDRAPDARAIERQAERAAAAAAGAMREIEASFAPLTTRTAGGPTAREQLANGALMAGNADDLRHTTGITDRPAGPSRNTLAAASPGGRQPGASPLLRPGPAIGTGDVTREVGPRTQVVMMPSPDPMPTDPVCRADAQGVARAIRQNIGGIRSCYERAVRNNPSLSGRLRLEFSVGESGRARAVSAQGLSPEVASCVELAVARIVFPRAQCGEDRYEFPIQFDHAED